MQHYIQLSLSTRRLDFSKYGKLPATKISQQLSYLTNDAGFLKETFIKLIPNEVSLQDSFFQLGQSDDYTFYSLDPFI